MNPPRRHYGTKLAGRLEGTMLKVLAAELSDAGRLGRGKRLFEHDAVTDIAVYPGRTEVVVQGSRPDPYEVMLATRPGNGVPTAAELAASCTCPDAETARLCKHGVAGLFALANEVAIEPELVTVWRSDPTPGSAPDSARSDAASLDTATTGDDSYRDNDADNGDLAPIIPLFGGGDKLPENETNDEVHRDDHDHDHDHDDDDDDDADAGIDETAAEINSLLRAQDSLRPGSSTVPDLGPVTPIAQRASGDRAIDRLLTEIYDEFDLGW